MALTPEQIAKANTISSIMKDPKMSKILLEAWDAPAGSTKNQQAAAILSSLQKSNQNYNTVNNVGSPSNTGNLFNPTMPTFSAATVETKPIEPASSIAPSASAVAKPTVSEPVPTTRTVFIKGAGDITKAPVPTAPTAQQPTAPTELGKATLPEIGIPKTAEPVYNLEEEIIKAGGKTAWQFDVMTDPDKLSQILGIPKEGLNWMPKSGLINESLKELREVKENEYGINNQLKNLMGLTARGKMVKPFIQDYIRGRDTYLNKLDSMLNTAKDKIAYMDLSNPAKRAEANNYLSYLTTLKGRQNQRYIDYLNSSIEQMNVQVQNNIDTYNILKETFEKDLADETAITKERYNKLEEILKGMADSVEERKKLEKENQKWEWEIEDREQQKLEDVLKLQKMRLDIAKAQKELAEPSETNIKIAEKDMLEKLTSFTDVAGYVSPEDWQISRKIWTNAGYNPTIFDTKFKGFINPSRKDEYGIIFE